MVTDWDLKLYDEPVQSMGQLGKKLEVVNDRSASLQEETSIKGKNNKVKKVKIEPKWMILSHTIDCQ